MRSEQINELATALSKAQGMMKGAVKDSANPFFKSHYADLSAVWDAIREPLSKNGLAVIQIGEGENLETILTHSSGQWVSSSMKLMIKDQTPQAMGSAMTYLRRYCLASITGCSQVDDDGEAAMSRTPSKPVQSMQEKPKQAPKKDDETSGFNPTVMNTPDCCGKKMLISLYEDKELNCKPFYCSECKKKIKR